MADAERVMRRQVHRERSAVPRDLLDGEAEAQHRQFLAADVPRREHAHEPDAAGFREEVARQLFLLLPGRGVRRDLARHEVGGFFKELQFLRLQVVVIQRMRVEHGVGWGGFRFGGPASLLALKLRPPRAAYRSKRSDSAGFEPTT